jgi:hypothetical protein
MLKNFFFITDAPGKKVFIFVTRKSFQPQERPEPLCVMHFSGGSS